MIEIEQQQLSDAAEAVAPGWPSVAEPLPPLPAQPRTLRETGLEQQLVVELIAKAIFIAGKTHLPILTGKLRLSINVLREVLDFMVAEQLAEVAWRGESDIDVQYQLTSVGKQRAAVYLERCAYAGPAPVTLDAYRAMVERQSWQRRGPGGAGAGQIEAVLGDGHLDPAVLDLVGAAMHAGRPMLLYGPAGGGKSTLAGKLGGLLQGLVAVPYAVLAGQEIIQVYDAALHLPPAPQQALHARQAGERRSSDTRWALCQRPLVRLGAELDDETLELRHDAFGGCYQAPPQFKANNGLLIVDDLGRQRSAAGAVLGRLLQPLEQGQDQLSLRGGHQFKVPFDTALVFATNRAPRVVLDESCLRRIGYKIHVGPLSDANYRALFRQQCRAAQVVCDEVALAYLVERLHGESGIALLACYPRQLIERVADFAGCAGRPPRLAAAALEQAWRSMFAFDAGAAEGAAA